MRTSRHMLGVVAVLALTLSACDSLSDDGSPSTTDQEVLTGENSGQTERPTRSDTDVSAATGNDSDASTATGNDSDASTATGNDSDASTATGNDSDASTATALPTGSDDQSSSTGDSDLSTATAGDLGQATSTPEDPSTEPDAPTVTPDDDELTEPSINPAEGEASGDLLLATSVRIGSHDGYDRVVFDLEGDGTPGYRVSYVDSAVESGSGARLDVAGDAILQVVITGTRYPEDDETYEGGPGTYSLEATEMVEVVRMSGTFEGTTQAFIGVDDEGAPFRAYVLSNPARLVVDVSHSE
ncbi:hypothetical protein BH23ACT6_BH23ACT6_04330 [soil metagenome]